MIREFAQKGIRPLLLGDCVVCLERIFTVFWETFRREVEDAAPGFSLIVWLKFDCNCTLRPIHLLASDRFF